MSSTERAVGDTNEKHFLNANRPLFAADCFARLRAAAGYVIIDGWKSMSIHTSYRLIF
jgi:hypothetical protein